MYMYNHETEEIIFWYPSTNNEQQILRYVTRNPYTAMQ